MDAATKLKVFLSGKNYALSQDRVFTTLEKDRRFNTGLNYNDYANMSLEEFRLLEHKRAAALAEYQFIENDDIISNPSCAGACSDAMVFIEWSGGMKYFLNRSVRMYNTIFCLSLYKMNPVSE